VRGNLLTAITQLASTACVTVIQTRQGTSENRTLAPPINVFDIDINYTL